MIDLRSDTISRPTAAMRIAMAEAEVGDDVYRDDPTVKALEARVAGILGTEDAVYVPTGTMSNQIALRAHTEPGDAVLCEAGAHVYSIEGASTAALSGITVRHLQGERGIFTAGQVAAAVHPRHSFMPVSVPPPVKLLCLENTHNLAGGTVWPLAAVAEVAGAARERGLALHLDGARLWHAAIATGVPESDYAAHFDTISVCFSKGLGAPVGSALAGTADFVARARRFKQMFGGGFRQAGVIAAGALYALENHRERLAEDHAKARSFAEGIANTAGIEVDLECVETNIVRFRVTALSAAEFAERCFAAGVHMVPGGADQVRAVMHLDISEPDVETALDVVRGAVSG
ncbi:MAG TPA: GntG family PLP-dependent aldolase [Alphaproteobacteria bacterium]|jgi:threonine aldolase|nr:GntG family PLP-dependent aldolase [Alphaproteobacteria bacterium]MDP6269141.1 GntG family PLP-dependent aldolase [Alphaproteobacteria bacterium]MDP7164616.1 GntG family PLP-dependent aldolase [Alphaproteobacteria bacterium]MDP7428695.1 GntG family PLP-dependent aldolase [Alphaproteobacteria bacterium]HJM49066.1 GntG family PLP-dependent aldolase [Alphaproteobacteria bacterium]